MCTVLKKFYIILRSQYSQTRRNGEICQDFVLHHSEITILSNLKLHIFAKRFSASISAIPGAVTFQDASLFRKSDKDPYR